MTTARERAAIALHNALHPVDTSATVVRRHQSTRERYLAAVDAVAAELDEPVHEVECPNCAATIRARMADADRREGDTASRLVGPMSRRIAHLSILLRRVLEACDNEEDVAPLLELLRKTLADNTIVADRDVPARERAALAMHLALNSGMTAGVTGWNAVSTRDKYLAAVDAVAFIVLEAAGVRVTNEEKSDK